MTASGDCAWLIEHWAAYEDGESAPGEKLRIEGHLAICDNCREQVLSLQKAWALFQREYPPETPEIPLKFPAADVSPMTPRKAALRAAGRLWAATAAMGAACCALALFFYARKRPAAPMTAAEFETVESMDPQSVELTMSAGQKMEPLDLMWSREIGGITDE